MDGEVDFQHRYEFRNFALGMLMGAMFDRQGLSANSTSAFEAPRPSVYG